MLIMNGKIVDRFFCINSMIMRPGKKDWKEAREISQNMTALGGYIEISAKSLHTFEQS